jgi:glycosyltransferase involved in cell wall biosynthesis
MFFILFSSIYLILVAIWLAGFIFKFEETLCSVSADSIRMSIVIAARNESKNLPALINSFRQLNYPKDLFEVIIVDDHSDDGTAQIAEQLLGANQLNGKVVELTQAEGKKFAIKEGVNIASADLIVTTDADCTQHADWLTTISAHYVKYKPGIIIMPVVLQGDGFFSRLQQMESIGLTGITGGSLAIGKPMMCNGANLAFEKNVYQNMTVHTYRSDIPSGDDTFFMLSYFERNPGKVLYVKSEKAIAYSESQMQWKLFMHQRIRWASKVKHYSQFYIKAIGAFLTTYAVLQLYAMVALPYLWYAKSSLMMPVVILGTRLITDFVFLKMVSQQLKQQFSLSVFFVLFLCYPFYTTFMGFISLFKGYTWKGREWK